MKSYTTLLFVFVALLYLNCKDEKKTNKTAENVTENAVDGTLKIIPIEHATLILESGDDVIYVDPTGGAEAFKGQKPPTLILITDIHGDHLSLETLDKLNLENSKIIAPKAVADKIPSTTASNVEVLNNGETTIVGELSIEAIPMYNLREEALKFHEKGRGNGYVLTINNERIYISGDTEDIPEMRNLKNIDKAFVCMNLPYTMPVENAASAVLDFKPKEIYPYHYRGTAGLSDINQFKSMVNEKDKSIKVTFLEWY
jgi:L-ascorbate metabolism protein UlaG (beta-lactamase superfamily)